MVNKTKDELSEELNEILGTSIDFTKLTKEDLTSLYEAILKLKEGMVIFPLLDKRKEQIGKMVKKGERILPALKSIGESRGILGILAKALAYNLEDWIKIIKGTRFVKL